MEEFNKNIAAIRTMFQDLKAEKYAITNPELAALDEYVKSLYLKVLCTIVQYENDPSDAQLLYLKRIMHGMGIDDTVEECMRKALEISPEVIQEFLSITEKSDCKYYFAMDGVILSALGEANPAGYEYLAEIIELLKIPKSDLAYICKIAQSVLEQQSSYYDEARGLASERVENLDFTPYIQNYYAGAIVDTATVKHYSAPDKEVSHNIVYAGSYSERRVIFENVEIDIDSEWAFNGCEEVIFRNCNLLGTGGNISIVSVGTVRLENCKIQKFTDRFANLSGINKLYVQNCEITACGYTCGGDESGGVLYCSGESMQEICLQGNLLRNCYIKADRRRYNYGVSGVFIGFPGSEIESMHVENNEFIGCSCINNGNYTTAYIGGFCTNNCVAKNNRCSGELCRVFEDDCYENNC